MRSFLRGIRRLGRRHVSKLLHVAAVVGVPVAVVLATGGAEAFVFWIVTAVWLGAAFYAAMIGGFLLLLVLSPIVFKLQDRVPDRVDAVGGTVARGFLIVVVLAVYMTTGHLHEGTDVMLPTPWPSVGAVIVLVAAVAAGYALIRLARRLKPPPKPAGRRRHGVAEPEAEFWSTEPVTAWRSWSWDGATLTGVHNRWTTHTYVASCPTCNAAPSWNHGCGIYAFKSPEDTRGFAGPSVAVGQVDMWGDVIEHENGYRASHARIVELWVGDQWRAERIRAVYPDVRVSVGSPIMTEEVA